MRGDQFEAQLIDDFRLDDKMLMGSKTRLRGSVVHLKRAGRIADRAQMSLRFEEILFHDGTRVPIDAILVRLISWNDKKIVGKNILKKQRSKSENARNIGTTTAIRALAGLLKGGRGTKSGSGTRATVGLARMLATRSRHIHLPSESELLIKFNREVHIPSRRVRKAGVQTP